jgi:hypothetical protein
VSNIDGNGATTNIAKKIWVDSNANPYPSTAAITDWGQINDKTDDPANPGHTKGSEGIGTPIGVPILAWPVNVNSGTSDVWGTFAGGSKTDVASQGRVPCSVFGCSGTSEPIIQENNAPQIRTVAAKDVGCDPTKPLTDATQPVACKPVAAENKIEESLYFGSFGVLSSNPFSASNGKFSQINGATVTKAAINAQTPATYRPLDNVYLPKPACDGTLGSGTNCLNGSAAGFLNWIGLRNGEGGAMCATACPMAHGTDLSTGVNYDTEIINTVTTKFGFVLVSGIPFVPVGDVWQPGQ